MLETNSYSARVENQIIVLVPVSCVVLLLRTVPASYVTLTLTSYTVPAKRPVMLALGWDTSGLCEANIR